MDKPLDAVLLDEPQRRLDDLALGEGILPGIPLARFGHFTEPSARSGQERITRRGRRSSTGP